MYHHFTPRIDRQHRAQYSISGKSELSKEELDINFLGEVDQSHSMTERVRLFKEEVGREAKTIQEATGASVENVLEVNAKLAVLLECNEVGSDEPIRRHLAKNVKKPS